MNKQLSYLLTMKDSHDNELFQTSF